MSASADSPKAQLLEQVKGVLAGRLSKKRAALALDYTDGYFRRVPIEELAGESPETLATIIERQLEFMQQRQRDELLLRVFNPDEDKDGWSSDHTIIEMVNRDMPFLVDTANLALSELEIGVHLIVHPVIHVDRDERGRITAVWPRESDHGQAESIIQLQVDRQTEPEVLENIEQRLRSVMADVRVAVEDWRKMMQRCAEAAECLADWAPVGEPRLTEESQEFLRWMHDDHFIFLGVRDYEVVRGNKAHELRVVEGSGLGLLRETEDMVRSRQLKSLSREAQANRDNPLIVTKTNARSSVHRVGYMDYVGVMRFDDKGRTCGERRFIGLFTSNAYNRSAMDTPLVRVKVQQVLERSGLQPGSHAWKSLVHILETLPRDELFQANVEQLTELGTGILNLQERQRVRLFIRRERFGRFWSCLVFIPRDRFNTENRERIQDILKRALKGDRVDYVVQISESALARLQVIVRPKNGSDLEPDVGLIEQKIVEAVRSWHDALSEILVKKHGEDTGLKWARHFGRAFPPAYRDDVSPWVAAFDVENAAALEGPDDLRMSLYRPRNREAGILRFKVFKMQTPIPLSDVLPLLENHGLRVVGERPYDLEFNDGRTLWIHDFDMVLTHGAELNLESIREAFQESFERSWRGFTESDGFNRLIIVAQLDWRPVKMIRAYCKYLLQTGVPFSQKYMEETLAKHPLKARLLTELFDAQFNPGRDDESDYRRENRRKQLQRELDALAKAEKLNDSVLMEFISDAAEAREKGDREEQVSTLKRAFLRALSAVSSLDEDRILHAFYGVIKATLRTNYYQLDPGGEQHEYISFKLQSDRVPDLPRPKPYREIWVFSPRVEGIHLRMGKVARGGLRWSDRREDFRTEVLGLMKAQNVKNTMIVPVGAKGGFVVKRPPPGGDRDAMFSEGVACYKLFINGLLDITDNLDDEEVVSPEDVVRRDEDDPYLVVAADKGTATFSDTANEIALERGFWLGDAFASGGSVGYDHKGMGITAKGAWENVKRHFTELGTNIQQEDFTVVGIGDMSGDVFGNGMLLSRHIRLQAAFNHLHIFLDPDPDPATSFKERERLFAMGRSSWADYDTSLVSKGGGVFSRQDKTIPVSPEVRAWLGIEDKQLAPHELIRELLKAPVDLLWNGGIGTYVKSSKESNADVGDLANNPLRVNGNELRCRVVGEGGNLGLTQHGRIEYAQAGGRINTDFIDNSAGVDCSDHEVNIKILLNQVVRAGKLNLEDRRKLLADMTDEVSELVLRSNFLQTRAISMMETLTGPRLGAKQHFISVLEDQGVLDRELEGLPDDEELTERRNRGLGLTRPELAVLLSYSKITLYQQLLASDVPEDPYLSRELVRYFPQPLQERYADDMQFHRLKREIIATQVTNSMVNRMGASFALRMHEDTGASAAQVAKAYTVAREVFRSRDFWAELDALDNQVDAKLQISATLAMWNLLRQVTRWLLNLPGHKLDIQQAVDRFEPGVHELEDFMTELLGDDERAGIEEAAEPYVSGGFGENLAHGIARLQLMFPALDVVEIAAQRESDVRKAAQVFFGLGDRLGLKWLRQQVESLSVEGQWHAHARGNLRDELYSQHRQLAERVLSTCGDRDDPVTCWVSRNEDDVHRVTRMMQDMRNLPRMDYATVSVAVRSLGQLLLATA